MNSSAVPERIVVLAMVSDTWTDTLRRGFYSTADQLFLSMMADSRVSRIVVADHPRGLLSQAVRRLRGDRPAPHTPTVDGVRPLTLRTGLPNTSRAVTLRYRLYDRQIQRCAAKRKTSAPALVTFNLWHAAYGDLTGYSRVVFYAQDDEREIPRLRHLRDRITDAYRAIAARGIPVCAVSAELLARIVPDGVGHVIPNGVDPTLWEQPAQPSTSFDAGGKARAVYVGTVDSRLDTDAVRSLVEAGFCVTLAGPVRDEEVVRDLRGITGLTLTGNLSRDVIPGLLSGADVCFLAHHRTPLTEAMSPLKLFEYLCSGTPVVATALPPFANDPDLAGKLVLVNPEDDFGERARAAASRGRLSESERLALVEAMSWRTRHAPLIDFLVGA
ncbi:glycosyltransferase [uncultured Williamsia sp.]|uniref:glycosyltransferase n=1 Tax=uncultured Williamsia sp. TaxID=259311 RepID=UPI00260F14A2|nr:glycosyltransferase [uncultured Williamsia sp.]